MKRLLALAFALAFSFLGDARAQFREIQNTPRAVVTGVTIAIWADQTAVGDAIILAEKNPNDGKWYGIWVGPPEMGTMQGAIDAAGGPAGYINKNKPAINAALARRFPSGSAGTVPTPTGSGPDDTLNLALASGFVFTVSADGKSATFGAH